MQLIVLDLLMAVIMSTVLDFAILAPILGIHPVTTINQRNGFPLIFQDHIIGNWYTPAYGKFIKLT